MGVLHSAFRNGTGLYNLLSGDATAEARKKLVLSKVGPEAFRILVDHHRPEAVTTKTYQLLKKSGGYLHSSGESHFRV